MKEEDEFQYFKVCLRMLGLNMPDYIADRVLAGSKLVKRKKGNANLRDVAKLMAENFAKYPNQPDPNGKPESEEKEEEKPVTV